jgi:hypothetical protein
MRGRFRESELVEAPPHQAEFWSSFLPCGPLPASGARCAAAPSNRSKCLRLHTRISYRRDHAAIPTKVGTMPSRALTTIV